MVWPGLYMALIIERIIIMVKHVILWKLKEELGDKSRQEVLSE